MSPSDNTYTYIIIDDHPLIRDGIRGMVSTNPAFKILGEFDDIRPTVTAAWAELPDIIILDLSLKSSDGLKSMPELRQRFPRSKIMVFSQHAVPQKQLEEAGASGFLLKTEREELVEALLAIIKGDKYFKQAKKMVDSETTSRYAGVIEKFAKLSKRELQIAWYMHQHVPSKEIALKLFVADYTVDTHRKNVRQTLGAANTKELHDLFHIYFDMLGNIQE